MTSNPPLSPDYTWPDLPEGFSWDTRDRYRDITAITKEYIGHYAKFDGETWMHWWYEGSVIQAQYPDKEARGIYETLDYQEALNVMAVMCWTQNYGEGSG